MASTSTLGPQPAVRWPRLPAATAAFPVADDGRIGFSFLVFCLYTFILIARPQDYLPALEPLRPALLFTVLTAAVTLLSRPQGTVSPFRLRETKLYLFFFAVMVAGIPLSLYPGGSFQYITDGILPNVVFFLLFLFHITTARRFKQIAFVLVLTNLFFTVVSLRNGDFSGGRYSTISGMFDPNDVASVEVSLLAFAVCVLLGSFGVGAKLLALASVVLGVLLALYTGSRGGLIGLITLFLLFLVIRVPRVTKFRKMVIVLALVAAAVLNSDKINIERYRTIVSLEDDYNTTSDQGRKAVWQRGLKIFSEHPLTGVGVSRFLEAIGRMRSGENVQSRWQAAHNSYLQVLVETGIFGAAAFLLLMARCIKTFYGLPRALARIQPASPDINDLGVVGPVLFAGFIGHLVVSFFLSHAYSLHFSLWFAVSASLTQIVASAPSAPAIQRPGTV
jgi:O-antigen ligase